MSNKKSNNVVGAIDINPSILMSETNTLCFNFCNFRNLSQRRGECIKTPSMLCHGQKWWLALYPRGDNRSSKTTEFISISLFKESKETIDVVLTMRIPNHSSTGEQYKHTNAGLLWRDYISRDRVLNNSSKHLVNGTLTVEVDIQVELNVVTWSPKNTVCKDMLKMFETAQDTNADVTFYIKDQTTIHAHLNILKFRTPALAAIVEAYDKLTPIPIVDVDPVTFRQLLRYAYGGVVPEDIQGEQKARELIDAANKYGCTGLKLAAESKLVSLGIDASNCADLMLYADATNCALLKEATIGFFKNNKKAVLASDGFNKMRESPVILSELLTLTINDSTEISLQHKTEKYEKTPVAVLLMKLEEKGLDLDGSKDILVKRLLVSSEEGPKKKQIRLT